MGRLPTVNNVFNLAVYFQYRFSMDYLLWEIINKRVHLLIQALRCSLLANLCLLTVADTDNEFCF